MSCCSATLVLNQFSMAETCFSSTSKATLSTKSRLPFLSASSKKPVNLSFSATFPSWASLQNSKSLRIIPLVSDWAQQQEEQEENERNLSWDNKKIDGSVDGEGSFGDGSGEDYTEPPEEAKLFVGNLPYDVDSESLALLFNQAGVVEISEVIYNRETGQSRGLGFVTMSTVEEAEKAVDMLDRMI